MYTAMKEVQLVETNIYGNIIYLRYYYVVYIIYIFLHTITIGAVVIELTSEPLFGHDVLFTCTANVTNVITVTVNDYGTAVFERNSVNTIIHLKSVLLNLTRRDPDPTYAVALTIFEVQGRVEEAQDSLNIKCGDAESFKTLSIVLRGESL